MNKLLMINYLNDNYPGATTPLAFIALLIDILLVMLTLPLLLPLVRYFLVDEEIFWRPLRAYYQQFKQEEHKTTSSIQILDHETPTPTPALTSNHFTNFNDLFRLTGKQEKIIISHQNSTDIDDTWQQFSHNVLSKFPQQYNYLANNIINKTTLNREKSHFHARGVTEAYQRAFQTLHFYYCPMIDHIYQYIQILEGLDNLDTVTQMALVKYSKIVKKLNPDSKFYKEKIAFIKFSFNEDTYQKLIKAFQDILSHLVIDLPEYYLTITTQAGNLTLQPYYRDDKEQEVTTTKNNNVSLRELLNPQSSEAHLIYRMNKPVLLKTADGWMTPHVSLNQQYFSAVTLLSEHNYIFNSKQSDITTIAAYLTTPTLQWHSDNSKQHFLKKCMNFKIAQNIFNRTCSTPLLDLLDDNLIQLILSFTYKNLFKQECSTEILPFESFVEMNSDLDLINQESSVEHQAFYHSTLREIPDQYNYLGANIHRTSLMLHSPNYPTVNELKFKDIIKYSINRLLPYYNRQRQQLCKYAKSLNGLQGLSQDILKQITPFTQIFHDEGNFYNFFFQFDSYYAFSHSVYNLLEQLQFLISELDEHLKNIEQQAKSLQLLSMQPKLAAHTTLQCIIKPIQYLDDFIQSTRNRECKEEQPYHHETNQPRTDITLSLRPLYPLKYDADSFTFTYVENYSPSSPAIIANGHITIAKSPETENNSFQTIHPHEVTLEADIYEQTTEPSQHLAKITYILPHHQYDFSALHLMLVLFKADQAIMPDNPLFHLFEIISALIQQHLLSDQRINLYEQWTELNLNHPETQLSQTTFVQKRTLPWWKTPPLSVLTYQRITSDGTTIDTSHYYIDTTTSSPEAIAATVALLPINEDSPCDPKFLQRCIDYTILSTPLLAQLPIEIVNLLLSFTYETFNNPLTNHHTDKTDVEQHSPLCRSLATQDPHFLLSTLESRQVNHIIHQLQNENLHSPANYFHLYVEKTTKNKQNKFPLFFSMQHSGNHFWGSIQQLYPTGGYRMFIAVSFFDQEFSPYHKLITETYSGSNDNFNNSCQKILVNRMQEIYKKIKRYLTSLKQPYILPRQPQPVIDLHEIKKNSFFKQKIQELQVFPIPTQSYDLIPLVQALRYPLYPTIQHPETSNISIESTSKNNIM